MGIAHPASVLGVFQARILDYIVISFSRDSTPPRDRTRVSRVSRHSLPLSHQGSLYKELAWNNKFSSVPSLNRVWLFAIPWTACSMPGVPVHHQLPELAQTHVHQVADAIQPSHPLLSPSPPAFSLSQHQGLFQWVSSSHQVAKLLEFQLQHQSFQWTPRTDLL